MRRKSLTFTNHTESQDRRHIFSSTKIKRRKPTSIRHETIACIIADRFFKLFIQISTRVRQIETCFPVNHAVINQVLSNETVT